MQLESKKNNFIQNDFRLYLQDELKVRCLKNPRYSLRAFAKSLRINHSTLSKLMSGKRPLTMAVQRRLAEALGLGPEEMRSFEKATQNTNAELKNLKNLEIDAFTMVSDWYHDAILELTRLRCFKPDPQWIATVLNITVSEVNIAVERMQRLKLLEISKSGRWKDLSADNTTNHIGDHSSVALRKYQAQILQKASEALTHIPRAERDNTSVLITVARDDIAEAKKMIQAFRLQMAQFFTRKKSKPTEIYSLAIALFPITQINGTGDSHD